MLHYIHEAKVKGIYRSKIHLLYNHNIIMKNIQHDHNLKFIWHIIME